MSRLGTGYAYDLPRTDTVTAKCDGCGKRERMLLDWPTHSPWVTTCSLRCALAIIERRWHLFYSIHTGKRPMPDWLMSYAEECEITPQQFVARATTGWEMELMRLQMLSKTATTVGVGERTWKWD